MLTFSNLTERVLALLDESGDTSTTKTVVQNALNESIQRRLSVPFPFMRWPQAQTFTTSVGVRSYPLHAEFHLPLYILNRTTGSYCVEVPLAGFEGGDFKWNTDTGSARHFTLTNTSPVAVQPSSASVLTLVSSEASDNTAAKAVTILGMTANGMEEESFTPNGVTPVVGTKSFLTVVGVTKAAAWTGTMTLTSNAGAVTVLQLLPAEYGRQYRTIEFLESPSQADVIEYQFYRVPHLLSADNDIPPTPFPFSHIHIYDALLEIATYNTELSAKHIQIWAAKQTEWDTKLEQAFMEGNALGAQPRFVRDLSEVYTYPSITR